jgi:hypothetical protein
VLCATSQAVIRNQHAQFVDNATDGYARDGRGVLAVMATLEGRVVMMRYVAAPESHDAEKDLPRLAHAVDTYDPAQEYVLCIEMEGERHWFTSTVRATADTAAPLVDQFCDD